MNELFKELKALTDETGRAFSIQYWWDNTVCITIGSRNGDIDDYTFIIDDDDIYLDSENDKGFIEDENVSELELFIDVVKKYQSEL